MSRRDRNILFGANTNLSNHPNLCDANALKTRFDDLPVHKICYFQSHYSTLETLERLHQAIMATKEEDILCTEDYFGLTPLHILAMSTKLDMQIWTMLIRHNHQSVDLVLHKKDFWGCSPLHYLCANTLPSMSTELIKYSIQSSISNRLSYIGLGRWAIDVLNTIEEISDDLDISGRITHIDCIYSKLLLYEWLEKVSLLELALWKSKIDFLPVTIRKDPEHRKRCHISCGVEVVMSNVLPFLGTAEFDEVAW